MAILNEREKKTNLLFFETFIAIDITIVLIKRMIRYNQLQTWCAQFEKENGNKWVLIGRMRFQCAQASQVLLLNIFKYYKVTNSIQLNGTLRTGI